MEQSNRISFKGQNIYVGIDVHLKSWSVTILSETSVLKKMSQGADPDALHRFLTSHYPEAEYYSVYEAGFCGFWIHDRLTELGVHNIVVNPADVPTMSSEKLRKTDAVDSRKLAVSLIEELDYEGYDAAEEPHQVPVAISGDRDTDRVS